MSEKPSLDVSPAYIGACAISLLSALLTMAMAIRWPKYREHPRNITLYRAFTDAIFAQNQIIISGWSDARHHCRVFSFFTQFSLLSSQMWYFIGGQNLLIGLTNPFVPGSKFVSLYHLASWGIPLFCAAFISFENYTEYRESLSTCWIKPTKMSASWNLHAWLMFFGPTLLFTCFNISVILYAACTLRRGLPTTFRSRKEVLQRGLKGVVWNTVYWICLGIFYFLIWHYDSNGENGPLWIYYTFAIILGIRGTGEFISVVIEKDNQQVLARLQYPFASAADLVLTLLDVKREEKDVDENGHLKHHTMRETEIPVEYDVSRLLRGEVLQSALLGAREAAMKSSQLLKEISKDILLCNVSPIPSGGTDTSTMYTNQLSNVNTNGDAKYTVPNVPLSLILRDEHFATRIIPDTSSQPLHHILIKFAQLYSQSHGSVVFLDINPIPFAVLRQSMGWTDEAYAASLQTKADSITEQISNGRSGSFFFHTTDRKLILKSISWDEAFTLVQIMPQYVQYLLENPTSLQCRYLGQHVLRIYDKHVPIIIMRNIQKVEATISLANISNGQHHDTIPLYTPLNFTFSHIYDLKGSFVNRSTLLRLPKQQPTYYHKEEYKVQDTTFSEMTYHYQQDKTMFAATLSLSPNRRLSRYMSETSTHGASLTSGNVEHHTSEELIKDINTSTEQKKPILSNNNSSHSTSATSPNPNLGVQGILTSHVDFFPISPIRPTRAGSLINQPSMSTPVADDYRLNIISNEERYNVHDNDYTALCSQIAQQPSDYSGIQDTGSIHSDSQHASTTDDNDVLAVSHYLEQNNVFALHTPSYKLQSAGVFKDNDLDHPLLVSPQQRNILSKVITKDTEFLENCGLMDYSLLVGVAYQYSDSQATHYNVLRPPRDEVLCVPVAYTLGMVDILTRYNCNKKMENLTKRYILGKSTKGLSSVNVSEYSARFLRATEFFFSPDILPRKGKFEYPIVFGNHTIAGPHDLHIVDDEHK